jgi:hypothetical protein
MSAAPVAPVAPVAPAAPVPSTRRLPAVYRRIASSLPAVSRSIASSLPAISTRRLPAISTRRLPAVSRSITRRLPAIGVPTTGAHEPETVAVDWGCHGPARPRAVVLVIVVWQGVGIVAVEQRVEPTRGTLAD